MTGDRPHRFTASSASCSPTRCIDGRLGAEGDYTSTGDNVIPPNVSGEAWEVPATINHTWGFRNDDTDWKSPGQIAFKLVDIVSKGGNYLLNVGPTAEGVIPQVSQDILRTVGRWLQTNGEAVYGAGPTPFGEELGEPSAKGYKDVRGDQLDLSADSVARHDEAGQAVHHVLRRTARAVRDSGDEEPDHEGLPPRRQGAGRHEDRERPHLPRRSSGPSSIRWPRSSSSNSTARASSGESRRRSQSPSRCSSAQPPSLRSALRRAMAAAEAQPCRTATCRRRRSRSRRPRLSLARDGRAPRRHSSTESAADPRGRRADDRRIHLGHVHARAGGLRRAVRRIDAGRARHRAATRRHRTRRVPSRRHSFLPTLRVAVAALVRRRSSHQSHLAVVDARGTNAMGHAAGRDEVLRSGEAAGHQPAGELSRASPRASPR